MAIGTYFSGRRLIRPQAATKIDDTGLFARGLVGANTLAIIGEATGGEPQKVLWFTDPAYAKAIFRSGNLLTAIQRAYDASDLGGAYLVAAIRVNPATQSTLALKDASANPLILLTSIDYGVWNNQIKVRIESGTSLGKKLTVTYGSVYDQGDNIYKKSFFLGLADAMARTGTVTVSIGAVTKTLVTDVTSNAQKIYFDDNGVSSDITAAAKEDDTSYFTTGLVAAQDYIYVESDIMFNALQFGLGGGVANTTPSVLSGEYWNGTAWTALPNFTDGTQSPTGTPLAKDGTISFYQSGGDSHTYPTGWTKTIYQGISAYWIRLKASVSLDAGATGDWLWIDRNIKVTLASYPTIQELVDYLDSLPGYEADVITTSPTTDLSTELDDVSAANLMGGGNTTLSAPYSSGRIISVAELTGFAIGDYLTISTIDGLTEEARRVTAKSAATGAGTLTLDSALSTTYDSGSIVREAKVLNSDLQAVIDWINAGNTSYISAAYHASAVNRAELANIPDSYMSGGSEGTTQQSDWDACLDLLKTEDTPLITCVTPEPSVWSSLSAHVSYMSSVGKKERRGFCGGFSSEDNYSNGLGKWSNSTEVNASVEQMLAYSQQLNSDRMYYVGPGFIAYDENGVRTTYNGAISAALIAGLAAALDVAEPLTHKSIKVIGLEYNLQWADLDRLLLSGVFPLEYDPGFGNRVCQSISTWLASDNYYRRELSTGRTGDFVARNVRDRLEKDFVGKKGTLTTLISIKNATESVLAQMARDELLAGDISNPPYKNIQVRSIGDIAYVDFECSPVIPVNYIPITIHLTVFTTTLSA